MALTVGRYDAPPMRLLLPPSETKSHGGDGPPLDIDRLGFPELTEARRHVVTALDELASDPERCRTVLRLSTRQDLEIARNASLWTSPTTPAVMRYTGVLYEALGVDSLPVAARRRAAVTVVVCSALFGALRPEDLIPAYRLSATHTLPGVGALVALWRPLLETSLANAGPVIDLRSKAYAALAPLAEAFSVTVIAADGHTVSHHNKAAKGQLVRAFLTAPRRPRTVSALIDAAAAEGIVLRRTGRRRLDLIA